MKKSVLAVAVSLVSFGAAASGFQGSSMSAPATSNAVQLGTLDIEFSHTVDLMCGFEGVNQDNMSIRGELKTRVRDGGSGNRLYGRMAAPKDGENMYFSEDTFKITSNLTSSKTSFQVTDLDVGTIQEMEDFTYAEVVLMSVNPGQEVSRDIKFTHDGTNHQSKGIAWYVGAEADAKLDYRNMFWAGSAGNTAANKIEMSYEDAKSYTFTLGARTDAHIQEAGTYSLNATMVINCY